MMQRPGEIVRCPSKFLKYGLGLGRSAAAPSLRTEAVAPRAHQRVVVEPPAISQVVKLRLCRGHALSLLTSNA